MVFGMLERYGCDAGSRGTRRSISRDTRRRVLLHNHHVGPHSHLSFAFAAAFVCHCMLLGASAPPCLSAWTWSMT